jgi:tetratricopeptide (TPR) repeat protein
VGLLILGCESAGHRRADFHTRDGVHLYRSGAIQDARESFEAALALSPGDPTLLYNLGKCHEQLGEMEKAEQRFQECLVRAPNHVEGRHALAAVLVRTARQDEAERMVQEWIAREPGRAAAYAEHGWLLRRKGDLPRAQARLQQALDLDPDDVYSLLEMGRLQEEYQRPARALVLYERASKVNPGHPDVQRQLQALLARGVKHPRPE